MSKASLASVAERVAFGGRTASADCVAESAVPLRLRRTTPRRFDWAAAGREVPGACLGQTQDFGFVWQRVHALCSGAWTRTLAASRSWAEAATLASSEPVRAISWRSVRIRLHENVVAVTGYKFFLILLEVAAGKYPASRSSSHRHHRSSSSSRSSSCCGSCCCSSTTTRKGGRTTQALRFVWWQRDADHRLKIDGVPRV